MLRKLSTKTIMKAVDNDSWSKFEVNEKRKFLYSVAGVAIGTKNGSSTYGDWMCFTGEFIAVVPGHEPLASSKVFLPDPIHSQLAAALMAAEKGVEFAVSIYIRPPTADETVKYVYEIEAVEKIQENKKVNHLLDKINKMHQEKKLLPAPKQTEKPTTKK